MSWRNGAGMLASITPAAVMWSLGKMCEGALHPRASLSRFAMTDGATIAMDTTRSSGQEDKPGRMEQWGCLMVPTQGHFSVFKGPVHLNRVALLVCYPPREKRAFLSLTCNCLVLFTALSRTGQPFSLPSFCMAVQGLFLVCVYWK